MDYDSIDSYRDDSYLTSQSTPRTRHPKGDTPLHPLGSGIVSGAHVPDDLTITVRNSRTTDAVSLDDKVARDQHIDRLMNLLDGEDSPPSDLAMPMKTDQSLATSGSSSRLEREATRQTDDANSTEVVTIDTSNGHILVTPTHQYFPSKSRGNVHGDGNIPSTSTPPPLSGVNPSTARATASSFLPPSSTNSSKSSEAGSISPSIRARSTSRRAQSTSSNPPSSLTCNGAEHDVRISSSSVEREGYEEECSFGEDSYSVGATPVDLLVEMGLAEARGQDEVSKSYAMGSTRQNRSVISRRTSSPSRPDYSVYADYASTNHETRDLEQRAPLSNDRRNTSDARIADEILTEFDAIVNHSTPQQYSNTSRPPSRLRLDPSPGILFHTSPDDRAHRQPISSGIELDRHSGYIDHHSGHVEDHNDPVISSSRTAHLVPRTVLDQDQSQILIQELNEANHYIAQLQEDMDAITRTVQELKTGQSRERTRLENLRETQIPLSAQEQAELAVARHLISLLPSLAAATPPARTPLPPSINSLALAVAFTRSVDSLIYNGPDGEERRDENVYTQANVDKMLKRIKKWERVVRDQS